MCGIAGFAGRPDSAALDAMTDALAHRGPDGRGTWQDDRMSLGHRRLSIVDLEGGTQPMWTSDGQLGVVFNGEIYNHRELRRDLEANGARFITDRSDTEVLLHGYRMWGDALPRRLNGMWAFAIYDRANGRLFCSRDRFGKKPFYYWHGTGHPSASTFVFSSELRSLTRHPDVPHDLDPGAVQKFFAFNFVPTPHSILRGVRKLPGGCNLIFDCASGGLRFERYWELILEPEPGVLPPMHELEERLLLLMDAAVRRRLMSEVPLGVFLSGGIDSSAVAALAARETQGLKTFCVGYSDATYDESGHARLMAQRLGTEHAERILEPDRARNILPGLFSRMDEPNGDASLLPTFLLCQFARERATVALGGDGGDEMFAGYAPFLALAPAALYARFVPNRLHALVKKAASALPVGRGYLSLDLKINRWLRGLDHPPEAWLPAWLGPLNANETARLFEVDIAPGALYSEAIDAWQAAESQADAVDCALQFFTRVYLQDSVLAKVDRASMLNSLEVRAPFLDIDLCDFVRRLPARLKLCGRTKKFLLKETLRGILPPHIISRPKQGFSVPVASWVCDESFRPPESLPCGMDAGWARQRWEEHRLGRANHGQFLWAMRALTQWHETANSEANAPVAGGP